MELSKSDRRELALESFRKATGLRTALTLGPTIIFEQPEHQEVLEYVEEIEQSNKDLLEALERLVAEVEAERENFDTEYFLKYVAKPLIGSAKGGSRG